MWGLGSDPLPQWSDSQIVQLEETWQWTASTCRLRAKELSTSRLGAWFWHIYFNFNKFHRVKDGVRRCKMVYGSVWGGTVAIECPGDCVHCRHLCSCCCGSPSWCVPWSQMLHCAVHRPWPAGHLRFMPPAKSSTRPTYLCIATLLGSYGLLVPGCDSLSLIVELLISWKVLSQYSVFSSWNAWQFALPCWRTHQ